MINQMKRNLRSIALAISATASTGWAQEPVWVRHHSSSVPSSLNLGYGMAMDGAGSIFVTGTVTGDSFVMDGTSLQTAGDSDALYAKLDPSGLTQSAQLIGGPCLDLNDAGRVLAYDPVMDRVIVAGEYSGEAELLPYTLPGECGIGKTGTFITSIDASDGDHEWARSINNWELVRPDGLLIGPNANIHLFGSVHSPIMGGLPTQFDGTTTTLPPGNFVARYSWNGQLYAAQRFMNSGYVGHVGWYDHDWLLTGMYMADDSLFGSALPSQALFYEGFLARVDTSGNIVWRIVLGSDTAASYGGAVQAADGSILATGIFQGSAYFPEDTITSQPGVLHSFIESRDEAGGLIWRKLVTGSSNTAVGAITIGPDSRIYVLGRISGQMIIGSDTLRSRSSMDACILKLDTNGTLVSAVHFGKMAEIGGPHSMLVNDHGIFVSGVYDSTLTIGNTVVPVSVLGQRDIFITKFDSISGFTGVQRHSAISEALHIYANPNNGLSTIDLPQSLVYTSDLVLSIFDGKGQLVQRVPLTKGNSGVNLDIRAQARGMYHVELGDGTQRYTGTIVLD